MIGLIQRVSESSVTINGTLKARTGKGLLLLLGIMDGDEPKDCEQLAKKTADLRIFPDQDGKMNLDVKDTKGEVLVISQFTLCADTKKGNRPSFVHAAPPSSAVPLYEAFIKYLQGRLGHKCVKTGEFGADMKVALVNDGPVTIRLSTRGE